MIRRSTLKPADAPAPRSSKPRCGSCGVGIPQLDGRPFRCSYCVGDPFFGKDGYLLDIIRAELEIVTTKYGALVAEQHVLSLVLSSTSSKDRRRMSRSYFGIAGGD